MWIHTASSGTKRAVFSTLIHRVQTILGSLQDEIQHLQQTFKNNGYSSQDSQYALHARNKPPTTSEKPMGVALLLYQDFTSKYISRMLAKHYIKTIHIPMKKTSNTLRPIKDDLCLKTSGVYCISCECGKVYVGQTSRTIYIRCQKHLRHLHHGQTEKSAVAETPTKHRT
jgi:hypothetical protein